MARRESIPAYFLAGERSMNRFISITRTIDPLGRYSTLDAIDEQGRAWWIVVGCDDAPETWTRTIPLPQEEGE